MASPLDRRTFLHATAAVGAALGLGAANRVAPAAPAAEDRSFHFLKISLAEWSFHRAIRTGIMDNLDFPKVARQDFDIDCVEYVNQFFADKGNDTAYLKELKERCDDHGVRSGLIMCDNRVQLGDPNEARRKLAIEDHYKWVEAAKFLGCHSIRVNAHSTGTPEEQHKLVADGLRRLSEFGARHDMNVIVENHGGISSNGKWLVGVIKEVGLNNCGTLPDFGNFPKDYDQYEGVKEMMPYAKGVSAKSHVFNAKGEEAEIDYLKMMKIVINAGYHGYVGIEWVGETPSEPEGVRLTKRLLENVQEILSAS